MQDTERMTMQEFVERHGITIRSERADLNRNAPDWTEANHYKVTLRHNGRQLTTSYSQGYGIRDEPDAAHVLDSLALDSAGYENAKDFEDWATEYGYDTDSRKAERTYRIVARFAAKLKVFLGEDLYSDLLWNTESL
jgi:hypothetical protein